MFLVRRDSNLKHLVLCVHFPSLKDSSSKVLEYTIKEEKSSKTSSFSLLPPASAAAASANHSLSLYPPCLKLEGQKSFSLLVLLGQPCSGLSLSLRSQG
jgi:hypothetical protein